MPQLIPYSGPFDRPQLIHLLRRVLFGVSQADLAAFEGKSMNQVIDQLLTVPSTPPDPPIKYYNTQNVNGVPTEIDPQVPFGTTWVNTWPQAGLPVQPDPARRGSLKAWWFGLMVNQDRNIREKMTLFLFNHIPVEFGDVNLAIPCYNYLSLMRQYSVGNFKNLVRDVSTHAAMLRYLNGEKNTKTAPDENYGRELQELFCIGKGKDSGYTEDDVKAAARVLTGWQVNYPNNGAVVFTPNRHDTTNKVFSAFYNNTVITGKSGATAGAEELAALLDMIFANHEVAKFLARKLYAFFIYYDYVNDPVIEDEVITPLADIIRNNNYELKPALKALFGSNHFYQNRYVGAMIKGPMDYIAGLLRTTNTKFASGTNEFEAYYKQSLALANVANNLQQNLGDPPNVAGWPAYYQEPVFHEYWMNTVSYGFRDTFNTRIVGTGYTSGNNNVNTEANGKVLKIDYITWVDTLANPGNPNELITDSLELLFGVTVSTETRNEIKTSILLKGQSSDYYWTQVWDAYKTNPTNANKKVVNDILLAYFNFIFKAAEFHLH